jgi:hypothetical protein
MGQNLLQMLNVYYILGLPRHEGKMADRSKALREGRMRSSTELRSKTEGKESNLDDRFTGPPTTIDQSLVNPLPWSAGTVNSGLETFEVFHLVITSLPPSMGGAVVLAAAAASTAAKYLKIASKQQSK